MPETLGDILQPIEQPSSSYESGESDVSSLLQTLRAFKTEAEDARRARDTLTRRNHDAYLGMQDWSHKVEGASTEFVPKLPIAVDRLGAYIQLGLTSHGDWFRVDLHPDPRVTASPLTEEMIMQLLHHRLETSLALPPGCQPFSVTLADGVKSGLLGALIVLKVHGMWCTTRVPEVEPTIIEHPQPDGSVGIEIQENLIMREQRVWKLAVELVRPRDYYPDPSGRGLYEMQETEVDLYELVDQARSDPGMFDLTEIEQLVSSFHDEERATEIEEETGQTRSAPPRVRHRVKLLEFWGTIPGEKGEVLYRNVTCVVANDRYLIRKPTPNPWWHQESPFVVAPLVRVPHSVWHKAVYDHVTSLQLAYNELYNLMQDGAMGAVWGIREVRSSAIENWAQFANGIPNGAVFIVREEHPLGAPVSTVVAQGQVPNDALNFLRILDNEFQEASLVNDPVPPQRITATQAVKDESRSSIMFDRLIGDIEEHIINPVLRKAWLVMLQNANDWRLDDIAGILGPEAANHLATMSPARRYATYAMGARFQAYGLSSIKTKNQDFQKFVAMLQIVNSNPLLAQAFLSQFSADKAVGQLLKMLDIRPTVLELTEEERALLPQRMEQLLQFQTLFNQLQGQGQGQGGPVNPNVSPTAGDQTVSAGVNQAIQPLTGLQVQG